MLSDNKCLFSLKATLPPVYLKSSTKLKRHSLVKLDETGPILFQGESSMLVLL